MPYLKTYDLFISHAWKYVNEYDRFVTLLDNADNFFYRNYSAPPQKPLSLNCKASRHIIEAKLENKIRPVNAFIMLSGMYYNYHEWMQVELEYAKHYNKPIIAVQPYGSEFIPHDVSEWATTCVGWNTSSIITAIRKYAI